MTVIEFYDRVHLHNIASTLMIKPDRVILIGDRSKAMAKSIALYEMLAAERGISVQFAYRSVNKNHLGKVVEVLETIMERFDDCVFDVTGGSEIYLVAVGVLIERYPGKIQCQRLRFKNSTVVDCDEDGAQFVPESFAVSVKETILLGGGRVKSASRCERGRPEECEFLEDVEKIWRVCRKDPTAWNRHLATLASLIRHNGQFNSLTYRIAEDKLDRIIAESNGRLAFSKPLMLALAEKGLINTLSLEEKVTFTFKNHRVKRCLTTAGAILEWYIGKKLLDAVDKQGNPIYHDIEVGVTIDWDRETSGEFRTYNEIDVIAMRGAVPMFISCKNGAVSVEELYKLNTVADQFGKRYAKKVLIATELDRYGARAEAVRARAEDMEIRLIEDIDRLPDSELSRLISTIWSS